MINIRTVNRKAVKKHVQFTFIKKIFDANWAPDNRYQKFLNYGNSTDNIIILSTGIYEFC